MLGLHIPCNFMPDIITEDISISKIYVFGSEDPLISTFDGKSNYYHYPQTLDNNQPVNILATFLKRIYTNNYNCSIKGDILVYSSVDSFSNIIDDSVQMYFLQQVALLVSTHHGKTNN